MVDHSDPKQVRELKKLQKIRRHRIDSGLLKTMKEEEGRAFIWDLMVRCGVFESCFSQSNSQTAFNLGERNVGLLILNSALRLCPELYLKMAKEAELKPTENEEESDA